MVKFFRLCFLCTIAASCATIATSQSTSEKLIDDSLAMTDIRAAGSSPFRLVTRFQVFDGDAQLQGSYTLTWASPVAWRAETSLQQFSDIRIADGNKLWVKREPPYFTAQIQMLWSLLKFPTASLPAKEEHLSRIETKKKEGIEYRVIDVSYNGRKNYTMYFDPFAPLPQRKTYKGFGTELLFEDYSAFDKFEFPRTLIERSNHKPLVTVEVQELTEVSPLPTDLLVPAAGARWMPWCPDPKPMASKGPLRRVPPLILDSARSDHTVDIYGIIGPDGRWHNLTVVRSGGRDLDPYFLAVLSAQRFTPAMCPDGPMDIENVVEFPGTQP